jgi:D-alanyl-D-alanine carboxypeptidase
MDILNHKIIDLPEEAPKKPPVCEDFLRLVNEAHPLPADYKAENLVSLYSLTDRSFILPPAKMMLNSDAAQALNDMCRAAEEEGSFECMIVSAFRTRAQQEEKYKTDPSRVAAKPGCSEHETGLAVDIIPADNSQRKN